MRLKLKVQECYTKSKRIEKNSVNGKKLELGKQRRWQANLRIPTEP